MHKLDFARLSSKTWQCNDRDAAKLIIENKLWHIETGLKAGAYWYSPSLGSQQTCRETYEAALPLWQRARVVPVVITYLVEDDAYEQAQVDTIPAGG
jgi:hypothetical protein